MAKKNADPASDRINEAVDDGSGCVETWEALSEVRESPNPDRRRFLRTVGFSFGALTLGSGVSAASGLEEIGDEDEDLPETHTEEVRGRKRGQLVSGAVRSSEVRHVADELGGKAGAVVGTEVHHWWGDGVRGAVRLRRRFWSGNRVSQI